MPKKRSRAGFSWKQEIGGVPVWGIAVAVVAMLGMLAVPAVVNATTPTAAPYVRPTDAFSEPTPTPTVEQVTALFIGDSYSAGAGASGPAARWTSLAAAELGWVEVNNALGGTGYVKTAGPEGCGLEYCGTYREVIDGIQGAAPNVVVISGGRNDGSLDPAAVESTIAAAQAKWPEARIIVTSPLWDDDEAPAFIADSYATVQAAATAAGATFVDLGQPLTGRSDLLDADGVHPNDAGYAVLAELFVAAVNA